MWFDFSLPNAIFLHWLFSSTLLTQLKPPDASEQAAKKVEGAALELPPGLTRPDPANPSSEKMTSQPTCFCLAYFPKSVTNLHRLFNIDISCINTHFDMFSKIKACMGVVYFLVCVRSYESNLSINICMTVGKKTQ